ncbi:MAG TPA: GNAT family N-acetyltransferase [Nocardioidaceae bacterium]|nr:GNAT family N-acetyltransferase [Nocardioidaceae bacterium]
MSADGEAAEDDEADLSLRLGMPDDAGVLAEVFVAAREAAHPSMPHSIHPPDEVHTWFRELLRLEPAAGTRAKRETWVAERDDRIVGYLILDPAWLDSLYVRPDLTGQGIGSVLLDLAKGLRPEGFALWVFETNIAARRFYARHGLDEAERTDGSGNEEGAPDIKMVWPGAVAELRDRINRIDDRLAELLNERAGITAEIQRRKPVPGHAGRDVEREAEIVARMADLAPNLGAERIREIMHTVIRVSLDAAESGGR